MLDAPYRAGGTALVRAAREAGAAVVDGLALLVAQAAKQAERFTARATRPGSSSSDSRRTSRRSYGRWTALPGGPSEGDTVKADPNLPRGVQAFVFEAAERRRRLEESVVAVLQRAGLREVILPVLDYAAPYDGVTAEGTTVSTASWTGRGRCSRSGPTSPDGGAADGAAPRADHGESLDFLPGRRRARRGRGRRAPARVRPDRRRALRTLPRGDAAMLDLLLEALVSLPSAGLTVTLGYAGLLGKAPLVGCGPG